MGDHEYATGAALSHKDFLGVVGVMLEAAGPSSSSPSSSSTSSNSRQSSPSGSTITVGDHLSRVSRKCERRLKMPRGSRKRYSAAAAADFEIEQSPNVGESDSEYKRRRAAELARLHRQKQKCYVESLREQIEALNQIIRDRDHAIAELNESVRSKDRMIERLTNIVLTKINDIHDKVDQTHQAAGVGVATVVAPSQANVITLHTATSS